MERRTLLQSIAAVLFTRPSVAPFTSELLGRSTLFGQTTTRLTDANIAALKAIAEAVLPTALGNAGRAAQVDRFVKWIDDYREGADRGHTYGSSILNQRTGPSPAAGYAAQFAALDEHARARGGPSFAALPLDERREILQAALERPQRITNMPARPNGVSLVADFMGYYFASGDAYDLAYEAAIGRDNCRSLEGSDRPPSTLRKA